MTPYYQDDLVTIYHGDCREVMNAPISQWPPVIVTDPPYDQDGDEFAAELVSAHENVALFGWPESLVRIAMAGGRVPDDWIVWWPTNAGLRSWAPLSQTPRESEHIAIYGEVRRVHGAMRSASAYRIANRAADIALGDGARGKRHVSPLGRAFGDVWVDPAPGLGPFQSKRRLHRNEKPLTVMKRLLNVVADGDVLDPFMGSGTTLVAAKSLSRRAVGIEIVEAHCEQAAIRCSQQVLGLESA